MPAIRVQIPQVSYWALYHLPSPDAQCALASELVSKLRVGGKAWFGGNMPSMALNIEFTPMTRPLWEDCFRTLYRKSWRSRNFSADIEMIEDLTLFRKMDGVMDGNNSHPGDYLFWPGTFSLLFTRRS